MTVEAGVALIDAALEAAATGWRVFPLHNPMPSGACSCGHSDCTNIGKHPRTKNGLEDATTNGTQIMDWWTRWPNANIGLATGQGLYVLDVDGEEGSDSLTCLETENGLLPETLECRTGREGGGRHLYFRFEGDPLPNSSNKLGTKLDTRGDGGYVILPPSLHESGRRYEWVNQSPVLNLPRWLIEKVRKPVADSLEFVLRDHTKKVEFNYGIHPYYRNWFERQCNKLARTPPGGYGDGKGGRNQRFFNLAIWSATCAQAGLGDASYLENQVRAAGRGAGLGEREMERSWESGWTDGWLKAPLQDPPENWDNKRGFTEREEPQKPIANKSSLVIKPLSKVRKEHVEYLWGYRLVRDGVNLLVGDGGLGKSAIALLLARSVTNGVDLPDDRGQKLDGEVMLVSYEDPDALVKERANVLGIDMEKFYVIEGQKDEDNRVMPFNKDSVLSLIEALEDYPDVRLLILDPWGRYLDDDDHKEKLIRRAIAPLEELAKRRHVTILIVGHTNKSTDYSSAEHRIAGHSAFKNVARSVIMIGKVDGEQNAIAHVKHNWSTPAPAVIYRWVEKKSWAAGENPLEWGEVTKLDADSLFASRKASKVEVAINWLRKTLLAGPMDAQEIKELAEDEGIADKTLRRASEKLEVVKESAGNQWTPGGQVHTWRLPSSGCTVNSVPDEGTDAVSDDFADLDGWGEAEVF